MKRLFVLFWRVSRNDLRMLWFAVKHPLRPGWLIPGAVVLTLYALSPLNFAIPLLGMVDDFVIVPFALHWLLKLLPQQINEHFERGNSRSPIRPTRYREAPRWS